MLATSPKSRQYQASGIHSSPFLRRDEIQRSGGRMRPSNSESIHLDEEDDSNFRVLVRFISMGNSI